MIARLRHAHDERWYYNVVAASADAHGYLTLELASYPHRVHYYLRRTSVLLAATGEDVTAMLREEMEATRCAF